MSELVDEVTRQDIPTSQTTTIREADDQGILHRVAAVFVFDKNGDLLLQVHEKSNGQLDHTVGGHVSAGETYEQAARREMSEEIGLVAPLKTVKLGVFSNEQFPGAPDKILHMFGIFEANVKAGWRFKPTTETKKLIPMPIEDVVRKMNQSPKNFTRGFVNTLDTYLNVNNLPFQVNVDFCRKNWGQL